MFYSHSGVTFLDLIYKNKMGGKSYQSVGTVSKSDRKNRRKRQNRYPYYKYI
jgi:hypothetical protein